MTEPHDPQRTIDLSSPSSDALEAGLAAGYGRRAASPRSSLGELRPVLLKEAESESSCVVMPNSDAMPYRSKAGDRYQLSGEIARGGMGVVLRGRDVDLGRDLAVKVLLERHANRPEIARRFIEEAQIGGQLQHPGVVPVYDIGHFGDRPFFTMKLVKGQTLAALLGERSAPTDDHPRLLGIALQVAQAMAYAHAKGVIHRDLKPANIMVGAFGEVQVMDWGLAKVLAEGGVADEERAIRAQHVPNDLTTIRTARSSGSTGSFGTETEAGSILGTPAYMPPEQASGDVTLLDRRADVFGLGAILCEILTGGAPYVGRSGEEVRRKAANGDLADATARLDACGADDELVRLTKACLAPEAIDRPKDAQAVANGLSDYLAGVEERLREAERARAVAEAKAIEERRRRKVQLALAGSVLAFTTLGGLSTTYYLQQRAAREAAGQRVIDQVITLRGQAYAQPDDVQRWEVALAAVQQADPAGDPTSKGQLQALQAEIEKGLQAASDDKTLLERLVDIRSAAVDDPGGVVTDTAYADAFRRAGINVDDLDPADAGAKIKTRPRAVAGAIVAALDHWRSVRIAHTQAVESGRQLLDVARAADTDPDRDAVRATLLLPDPAARLERLRPVAERLNAESWAPASLVLLANALANAGDVNAAVAALRQAAGAHPGDAQVHYALGLWLQQIHPPQPEAAIRALTASRALQPELAAHELAHALEKWGQGDEAEAIWRDLVRRRPDDGRHLSCFASQLQARGRAAEAAPLLEHAVAVLREAIRQHPDDASAHFVIGNALSFQGKYDEAAASFRDTLRLRPGDAQAQNNLGTTLIRQGKFEEAIAAYRAAIRLQPDFFQPYVNLGQRLLEQGQHDGAITTLREAIRLRPDDPTLYGNLGAALFAQGRFDEAIAVIGQAIRLNPNHAPAHSLLGSALFSRGRLDEAIAAFREAIRLNPDDFQAHDLVGGMLCDMKGDYHAGEAAFREAIRLKPDLAEAHINLGTALMRQSRFGEALAAVRRGHELGRRQPGWTKPSAEWVRQAERTAAMEDKLTVFLKGEFQPGNAAERLGLAGVCKAEKLNYAAAGLYLAAFAADPKLADDLKVGERFDAACCAALAGAGQGEDAAQLDDNERARLRKQALEWLRADLTSLTQQLENDSPTGFEDQWFLLTWEHTPNLDQVRDPAALTKLPEAEREEWQALWQDVAALRKTAAPPEPTETQPERAGRLQPDEAPAEPNPAVPPHEPPAPRAAKSDAGPDNSESLDSIHKRAHTLEALKPDDAERLFRQAHEGYRAILGPDDPLTLELMADLARVLSLAGRHDEVEPLLQAILESRRHTLGPDHQDTFQSVYELGLLYKNQGRLETAEAELAAVADLARRKYGADHSLSVLATVELADMAANRGDREHAEQFLTELLTAVRQAKGDQDVTTMRIKLQLAALPQARGDWEASARQNAELLKPVQDALGEDHWITLVTMNNLGYALARGGKFAEAEKMLQDTIECEIRALGEGHRILLQTRTNLGELYLLRGNHAQAEELLRQCLAAREKQEPNSFRLASTQSMLGHVLAEQKKFAEAEPLLLTGYEGLKENASTTPGWGKYYLPDTLAWLVQLYQEMEKPDEAARWQQVRAAGQPPPTPSSNLP